jgi:hypothetical protein
MTIDHIGVVLYPTQLIFRIIGRLAFPLFAYLLVLGLESTRNRKIYLLRFLFFAAFSQIPFFLAFGYQPLEGLNIFFTLFLGAIFVLNPFMIVFLVFANFFMSFDYGLYGILLIGCMRILKGNTLLGVVSLILMGVLSFFIWDIQVFFLFSIPIIILYKKSFFQLRHNLNFLSWHKYLFYFYYPVHLAILYVIKSYFL